MEHLTVIVVAGLVLLYAAFSARLEGGVVTGPMAFLAMGWLLGPGGLGLLEEESGETGLHMLAEATLVLVLFGDASRIDFRRLRNEYTIPLRMLLGAMPLVILLGAAVASWLLPGLGFVEAALLAAILAPTDAALGQAVVSNPIVPVRIRQSLNVESGLNDGLVLPAVVVLATAAELAGQVDLGTHLLDAAGQLVLGPAMGIAVGWGGGLALESLSNRSLMSSDFQKIAGLAIAFLAFAGAEAIGGNGFIAAFVAGFTMGNVTDAVCDGVYEFMETEGHLLVLVTFVVFGAFMVPDAAGHVTGSIVLYAVLSLTVIRMIPTSLSLLGLGLGKQTHLFLGWFGPRGLASILFSLLVVERMGIAGHDTILTTVVVTVTLSVFAHGISAQPAARVYGGWTERAKATREAEHQSAPDLRTRREEASAST